ncbi:MAG: Rrf2 family transcriptional regulator [Cyanobacteria bacterium J06638_7]
MLSRQGCHALKALLELAGDPAQWRSTHALAAAQRLPQPMLEQLLLQLRRAGLLDARRGRMGGYRLALEPGRITVAAVLAALGEASGHSALGGRQSSRPGAAADPQASAADTVTGALQRRLERARQQALEDLTLAELLFDLRSAEASAGSEGGLLLG